MGHSKNQTTIFIKMEIFSSAAMTPPPLLLVCLMVYSQLHNSQSSIVSLFFKSAGREDSFSSVTVSISAVDRSEERLGGATRRQEATFFGSVFVEWKQQEDRQALGTRGHNYPVCFKAAVLFYSKLRRADEAWERLILLSCQVCQHEDAALH